MREPCYYCRVARIAGTADRVLPRRPFQQATHCWAAHWALLVLAGQLVVQWLCMPAAVLQFRITALLQCNTSATGTCPAHPVLGRVAALCEPSSVHDSASVLQAVRFAPISLVLSANAAAVDYRRGGTIEMDA